MEDGFLSMGIFHQKAGFTIVEMLIAMGIVASLAAIALPVTASQIDKARNARAISEVRTLEKEIDTFEIQNKALPDSLAQVGKESLLDPWGNPYQYKRLTGAMSDKPRKDRFLVPVNMEGTYQETLHRWNIIRNQVLMVLFFSLFLVALLALVFSHRVAGPLFRIGKCVDLFAQGKDSGPIRLRKHDHYKDLATSLERLRQRLCRKGFLVQKNEPSS